MSDTLFELRGITVAGCPDIPDLVIGPGATCITGPSGAGKTTLLKILNSLVTPSTGTVFYRGTDIAAIDPVQLRREVVLAAQEPVVFPGSIADNVRAGCRWAKKPLPTDGQVEQLLADFGLKIDSAQSPERLSGGEKQRLCLARVMAMNPAVLLADEPTAGLDEQTEQLVGNIINTWRQATGSSVVVVTHSRQLAATIGQTIIRLPGKYPSPGGTR